MHGGMHKRRRRSGTTAAASNWQRAGPVAGGVSVQTMHPLSARDWVDAVTWTANLIEPGGLIVIVDRVQIGEPPYRDWSVVWSRIDSLHQTYAEHLEELRAAGDRP